MRFRVLYRQAARDAFDLCSGLIDSGSRAEASDQHERSGIAIIGLPGTGSSYLVDHAEVNPDVEGQPGNRSIELLRRDPDYRELPAIDTKGLAQDCRIGMEPCTPQSLADDSVGGTQPECPGLRQP